MAHPVVAADMTVVPEFLDDSSGTQVVVVRRKPLAYNQIRQIRAESR